jgi:predicted transcriptional regulator
MKLLLYCTKAKPQLVKHNNGFNLNNLPKSNWELKEYEEIELNGKIAAECDFEVEEIVNSKLFNNYATWEVGYRDLLNKSNLTEKEIIRYLGTQNIPHKVYKQYSCNCGYAIHIKNLHIFDEPKKLSEYYTFNGIANDVNNWKPIEKAPQNMMYAYELISELGLSGTYNMQLRKNIVISIRPEWLCKILNGEKTIEVRKKVLKEMLKCI